MNQMILKNSPIAHPIKPMKLPIREKAPETTDTMKFDESSIASVLSLLKSNVSLFNKGSAKLNGLLSA